MRGSRASIYHPPRSECLATDEFITLTTFNFLRELCPLLAGFFSSYLICGRLLLCRIAGCASSNRDSDPGEIRDRSIGRKY